MPQSLQQALKMVQTAALDPDPSCSEQPCIVPWQVCSAVKSHSQLVLDQGQMNGHYYVVLLFFPPAYPQFSACSVLNFDQYSFAFLFHSYVDAEMGK